VGKPAAKRRFVQVTETEIDVDKEREDASQFDDAPLFAAADRKAKRIELVSVRRTDPPSGYLGVMPPDVSEARLAAKWGGGTYVLEGKDADTKIIQNAHRRLKIAGNPIFSSEVEEHEYRRSNGLPEKGATDGTQISTKDLLVLIEEKDEKRRAEQLAREERLRSEIAMREDRERKEREDRAVLAAREQEERKERERKETEEREDRRRREQREDDERRARIHREDMERMANQNAAQLAQAQQFFTQLTTSVKADAAAAAKAPTSSGGEMVKALLTGLQIAREIGGGAKDPADPPDLLTSLVSRLPEILQEVRETGGSVYREIKGGGPQAPAVAGPPRRRRDELTIQGPTALKAKRVLLALKAAGKNPEAELDRLLTFAASSVGLDTTTPATPEAPAPAAAAVVRTKRARTRPAVRTKQAARGAQPPARAAAARRRPRVRKASA